MRANSLALRLFLSATAWTVVILFATGVVLSSFYRHAVERAFDRRLGVYLKTLVADVASPEESAEKFPQSLGEPRRPGWVRHRPCRHVVCCHELRAHQLDPAAESGRGVP